MARGGSPDVYGSEGSVPDKVSMGGVGESNPTRANPNDFGAQVGEGLQKIGVMGEQTAGQINGLIAETASNQAELAFIKSSGDLKAKYSKYEGLQAEAMRPQYEADLQATHDQFRNNLPPAAQKMFDSATIRSLGTQTSEYANYSAGQIKQANLKSHDALADNAAASAGNLSVVTDPAQFGKLAATIVNSGNAIADIRGDAISATGTNSDTGNYSYSDTPEGKAAEARHLQYTNAKLSNLYETAVKTVADNQGAAAAADWAKGHWDNMPDIAKVKLNAYLAPKMVNEDIDSAIATANSNMAANQQQKILSDVPKSPVEANAPLSVRNNNPGNLRDSSTGLFRVFDTPEAGASAMQSDLTAKISGNSPAMEKNFGKNYSPTLSNIITTYAPANENNTKAYIDTVSKETGFAPNQVLTTADISKLMPAMTKVEAGGSGSGGINKQYTNDYERLTDQRQSFIDNAVNTITQKRGTDLGMIATTQKRAEANIDAQIRVAKGALDSDQKNVQGAIDGSATNGKIPMTVEQLRAAPNMAPLIDKVQREQPEFYNSILTRIAKAQHTDATQNSPNAYDAIQATLDTSHPWTRQEQIEYLSKGLGNENPGFSISQKDYNDAKPAIDLEDGKDTLSTTMKSIATANGNLDGKGQDRAVAWYNQTMGAWKENQAQDKPLPAAEFFDKEKGGMPPSDMPSRIQQMQNVAAVKVKQVVIPTFASPDSPDFAKLLSGARFKDANGKEWTKK